MSERPRQTKAAQRETTVRSLITVARRLFAQHGYAQASTEEIVRQAGVTRGALYHHFDGKEGLFHAVLDDVQQDVARRVAEAAESAGDPWQQLLAGCRAFLTASTDAGIQQIMLVDAPAVLGWEPWRRMDQQYSMRLLSEALRTLAAEQTIAALPVEALSHLLSGAMNEAALWIARSEREQEALDEALVTLEFLLNALYRSPGR